MKKDDQRAELATLDVIRVETALSRYPVHRLAKQGIVRIELREENAKGETTLQWEVSHNSKYGQPGPLAYKLDTLILNRRIEEARRPIPKIIKLGSLTAIIQELGLTNHDTHIIKHALYQNASAFITAKIRYRANDGTERTLEAGFTRYNVVFTGEKLPDGRTADAVYLVLSDIFMQVIDGAQTRPLDYDYLKDLHPASQRFYELASYAMYATLKNNRPRARLSYSEFCMYAPQTRYEDFDRVKKQMYKIHAPHRKSGYIAGVEFEATSDREGRPDWTLIYTPGPKAKAEYQAFTKKGGPVVLEAEPVKPEPEPEPTGLERELIDRGMSRGVAAELVRDFSEDQIRIQIANLDGRRRKVKDPGAWLTSAIRGEFAPPRAIAPPAAPIAPVPIARTTKAVDAYWRNLGPEKRAALDAAALANADPERRVESESETRPFMKRLLMSAVRDEYLKRIHDRPVTS